jgi:hypothetical protein
MNETERSVVDNVVLVLDRVLRSTDNEELRYARDRLKELTLDPKVRAEMIAWIDQNIDALVRSILEFDAVQTQLDSTQPWVYEGHNAVGQDGGFTLSVRLVLTGLYRATITVDGEMTNTDGQWSIRKLSCTRPIRREFMW